VNHIVARVPRKTFLMVLATLTCLMTLAVLLATSPAQARTTSWAPWTNQTSSDPITTPDTPAVVSDGASRTYIVLRGQDNQIRWTDSTANQFRLMPGGWRTAYAPTAVLYAGQLWVFIRGGNDQQIWFRRLESARLNQWSNWQSVPHATSIGTPSVVVSQGHLFVFYTGTDNRLRYSSYTLAPARWRNLSTLLPFLPRSRSSPGVVVYGPSLRDIAVFHRGYDNQVYRIDYDVVADRWIGRWVQLPGVTAASRPVASATGTYYDTIEVAVRGTDGYPWVMTIRAGTITYSWHPQLGGVLTNSAPELYSVRDQAIYLVVRERNAQDIWGCEVV
jgi:hypothetical protein